MKLSEIAIRRPVFTSMMSLSMMVVGGLGLMRLSTDMFPDVSFPLVTITTVYPGAGPQDVEKLLSRPLEDAVAGINGVRKLMSWSRENVSVVFIQFELSVNLDRATQETRERVAAVTRNLPEQAEEPQVARFDIRSQPILVYTATGNASVERVRQILEDRVKPELEQVNGVALVRVEGGRERELRVLLHREKLDALYLPVGAVFEAIKRENVNIPSGQVRRGPLEISVRADAQLRSAEQIRRIVVQRNPGSTPVYLSDVADVVDGYKDQRILVRTNGQEAVSIEVVKQAGTNTLELANLIKARLAELVPTLPDRIEAQLMIDGSRAIADNAEEVEWAIVFGGLMAIFVILFFLLDVRGTLISATALPTAVMGTFAVMYALDYSLNMMTLIGLSLAIGLLIDDSVVVREAITHRLEAGEDPYNAARNGTEEVGLAVLATTFTICAVFVPVAFMSGMVGQFFQQFGITVAGAVLLSTFVALTLDPMLSARLSVARKPGEKRFILFRVLERGYAALERFYAVCLRAALRFKITTLVVAASSLVAAGWLAIMMGLEFLPNIDEAQFFVNMEFPAGTSLEESSRRSLQAEREILKHPDVVAVNSTVGFNDQVRKVRYRVKLLPKDQRSRSMSAIKDDLRPILDALPQVTYAIADPIIIEGFGDVAPIIMQIRGPDMDVLQKHAHKLADLMRTVPGIADVDVKDSPGLPEISIEVDRDRAREKGLTASDIAIQSRLAMYGEVAGQMFTGGDHDVDIRVMLSDDYRRNPELLSELNIFGPMGPVPMSDVTTLRERSGPAQIDREGRQRSLSVTAYARDRPLGTVVQDLHAALDPIDWGEGYSLIYEGMQREMGQSNKDLLLALVLALVFLFMVLASQFESITHPFTIVLSLPLAFFGAITALWAANSSISIAANIGFILLMGLSTKNGILLVDGALQRMRNQGVDEEHAMMLAGPRRLRPILMTSAAMVLGMLPTAMAQGSGSEFRSPMALAVVGGVISNTLLTLLVVPVIFVLLERLSRFTLRAFAWIAPATAAPQSREKKNGGEQHPRAAA